MPLHFQFPMGPGSDGPLGAMAGMEPHHMNGSLGNKPRKLVHLLLKRITNNSFKLKKCYIILTGSGDMDGMNKVNLVVTKVMFSFRFFFFKPYVDID